MLTQIGTFQGKSERLEDVICQYREQVLPKTQKKAGIKGGLSVLVDHQNGRLLGVILWEKQKTIDSKDESAEKPNAVASQNTDITRPPVVDIYEITLP